VILAPRGKKPSWGGFAPQLLGFEICQKIAEILKAQAPISYIEELAQDALSERRADLGQLLTQAQFNIQIDSEQATWWTFAGGSINNTLKYGLQFQHDWKIVADNFKLKIAGDSLGHSTLSLAIEKIQSKAFWNHPATQDFILSQLPQYRLSKFQKVLPQAYSLEMVSDYLLSIPRTIQLLQTLSSAQR